MSKEREHGWRLLYADFSVQASGKETATGTVMFIRSPEQRELWHKMPEELLESDDGPPLYVVGHGFTFDEAFENAIKAAVRAKPIPASNNQQSEVSVLKWISFEDEQPPQSRNVLLWVRNTLNKNRVMIARHVERYTEEQAGDSEWFEFAEDDSGPWLPTGWYEQTETIDEYASYYIDLSSYRLMGWMPLPKTITHNQEEE